MNETAKLIAILFPHREILINILLTLVTLCCLITTGCKDASVHHDRGLDHLEKGQYDKAISEFTKALEIKPWIFEAHYNRGLAYFYKSEYDLAISDFNTAIAINPIDADSYLSRGAAYYYKDDYD